MTQPACHEFGSTIFGTPSWTFLLADGTPAGVVMELLGHSQIGITMNTYAHVLPALSSASVEVLASQLAGSP